MSIITDLHNAILTEITSKVAGIETSGFYPKLRTAIKTPAVFIDLATLEPGTDPGTEELALLARFEARVVLGSSDTACLSVRELAAEVARIVHKNNFGVKVKPGALTNDILRRIGAIADDSDLSITEICKMLGISRRTYYKGLRFTEEGE